MSDKQVSIPERFGLSLEKGGAHTARTIMVDKLEVLHGDFYYSSLHYVVGASPAL